VPDGRVARDTSPTGANGATAIAMPRCVPYPGAEWGHRGDEADAKPRDRAATGRPPMTAPPPDRIDVADAQARLSRALDDHEQAFERFFFARFLDLDFGYLPDEAPDAAKDVCRVTFPVTDMLRNPQGVLHGGVMCSVMDISMGHLVAKVAGPGATIEMKVQFIRPVAEGRVTVEGSFTRRGRTLSFMESRLYEQGGALAAHATATWKMPGR
jgi:uncharacterized protein (TIGR00369 family)